MQPLEKSLRNKLERTVKEARDISETAARASLEQLGVGEPSPYSHLSDSDKELRRKLRVHGRQLGDERNATTEEQEIARLIEEVAYEHWHRMLFARFLAENNLLMFDGVAVTLEECGDLAADEGAANGWELAARCAAKMLPQIFRPDSPVFLFTLPPEYELKLESLVAELSSEVFTASDSLGWVYQFWQAKRKDEVNASEVKIGARELPAVTQLFTEPYMVSFLLDNALGAWWAARRLSEKDFENQSTKDTNEIEKELREKASIPGVPLEYLRFVKQEPQIDTDRHRLENQEDFDSIGVHRCSSVVQKWTPAAGTFDGWPEILKELKILDPCCGSGHFLVAVFLMLVPMRMELEKLSAKDAVDSVLRENIHGLELDQRCVELAAFALALTAWRYPAAGGYRPLPDLQVACSGLSVSVAKEEWKRLALDKQNLRIALDWMYDVFTDAPVLGSLLNPAKTDAAKLVSWEELSLTLGQALKQEPQIDTDKHRLENQKDFDFIGVHQCSSVVQGIEASEMGIVAQGLAKAATLLADKYHFVVTNVPYLARGKQSDVLKNFCEKQYPAAKNDLATVFLERCLELCGEGGTASVVLPQNWLFLTSYKRFREKLLVGEKWNMIARLGEGGFDSSAAAGAFVAMITISHGSASFQLASDQDGRGTISGLDVSEPRTAAEKAAELITAEIKQVVQAKQLENPDAIIKIEDESGEFGVMKQYAVFLQGCSTGDEPRFVRSIWELNQKNEWKYFQSAPDEGIYSGLNHLWDWPNDNCFLSTFEGARIQGFGSIGQNGFVIAGSRRISHGHYAGGYYSKVLATCIPKNDQYLLPIFSFMESGKFEKEVRKIDQKILVTPGTFEKVPFNLDHWTKVAAEKYPDGLPKPYSDDPTQWIFHGHPEVAGASSSRPDQDGQVTLQVAIARLIGYRWPAELDSSIELSSKARALVRKSEELLPHADEYGIVCILPVRGEMNAEDRLENLLAAAYGSEWSSSKKTELLAQADHAGKSMETWLRDKFFVQHCKLFQHRPFIWHIWDGLHDGFSALVNYHKLDYKTLETLIYTYLGDWISQLKHKVAGASSSISKVAGASSSSPDQDDPATKLAAAEQLKKKLELILEGEAPYDIFVRWKSLDKQPIGWNPDLNDGVRLNIRPFITAGVLRFNKKPQINVAWDKDRGKDVESAPWYHMFNGDRINDHHLTLAEKHMAREI